MTVLEAALPSRLGPGFRWLVAGSWASNLGDGLLLAAGPLLVASLTEDPLVVALSATLVWLPALLFALPAGVVSDRLDRRAVLVAVDLGRAAAVAALAVTVALGAASVPLVLAALFVLGTAEVFADNTSATLLPSLVARDDLALGNARITAGVVTLNQLTGPPLGALLFGAAHAAPLVGTSLLIAAGAVLVSRLRLPPRPVPAPQRKGALREVAEGLRWVRASPPVRTLVLTILLFNLTFGAAWSVLVLYSTERLGLGPIGFGLVTAVQAAGGIVGTLAYGALTRRVSLGNLLRIGLVLETLTHLALAITTSPAVALPVLFLFGAHAFVWGTTSITVRQRAVPLELQGRVTSVNTVGVFGGLVVGSALGGLLARELGLAAPFWFAFAGSAVLVAVLWRQLALVAHADAAPLEEATA